MKKNYWGKGTVPEDTAGFKKEFVGLSFERYKEIHNEELRLKFTEMNDFNMETMARQHKLVKEYESNIRNRTIWINILTVVCVTVIIVAIWTS
jgi:hypothetical protein